MHPERLKPMGRNAKRDKVGRQTRQVGAIQQGIMNRRADVARDAAFEQAHEAGLGLDAAPNDASDPRVIIERSLDVEANPVDERQYGGQPCGIGPGGVQSDAEAEFASHSTHRVRQRRLEGGFAAREHHAVEQAAMAVEKRQHDRPRDFRLSPRRNQMRVVAIAARPRAALAEHRCHELAQPGQSANPQFSRARRASAKNLRSLCSPFFRD